MSRYRTFSRVKLDYSIIIKMSFSDSGRQASSGLV